MAYIRIPTETDEDLLSQQSFDFLVTAFPGWVPSEGQLDVWIILTVARLAADLMDLFSDVEDDIYRDFGANSIGLVPFDEIPATVLTNWTLSDTAGHTIDAGMRVGVYDANLDVHEFEVAQTVVVPSGSFTATGVQINAVTAGDAENGIGFGGSQAIPMDGSTFVDAITLQTATGNGQDAEDAEDYLSRLRDTLRTMAPRPILPNDFAILARDIPGVVRSLALDGYNPADTTFGNARMISIAVTDALGLSLSTSTKSAVATYLASLRELNFIVNVIDPTYTTVDVQWDVNKWPGYDSTSLASDINSAISSFLDKTRWGMPPGGNPSDWYSRPAVKVNDLIMAIGALGEVKDVNSVTIRTGATAFGTADVVLAGAAALPNVGTLSGTVH